MDRMQLEDFCGKYGIPIALFGGYILAMVIGLVAYYGTQGICTIVDKFKENR